MRLICLTILGVSSVSKMKKRKILNIINFIRAIEPRNPAKDILTPVKEQIRLMKQHNLRGTFLLQYDTMLDPTYMDILLELDRNQFEFGIWHEIVQPQVEACGVEWRGRFPWDWHCHCGFPVGYPKHEREMFVDVSFEKFKELFGHYPRVFGSWFFDSHTARYVNDKYGVDAMCNCKEQYGSDGYTLWGGYYGQGYYPSRNNVFLPAQSLENQIDAPVFRMLGGDPLYQYDYKIDINQEVPTPQGVMSLEPSWNHGGGDPKWVEWFMRENYNGDCLSFGYAQAGQENSFGWNMMGRALTFQFEYFSKLQKEGKLEVEPLGDTGRWYKETYKTTPASAITAYTAFDTNQKNSVWFCSKNYRINLFGDNGKLRIRDIHLLSDNIPDIYETTLCTGESSVYEALPFIDGNRYTGKGILAGGYITYHDGTEPTFDVMEFNEKENGDALVTYGGLKIELNEVKLKITGEKPFVFERRIGIDGGHLPEVAQVNHRRLKLVYRGTPYSICLTCGNFETADRLISEGNVLEFCF